MMRGRELGYILRKSGIPYAKFAEYTGKKSASTVQRWVSSDSEIKGVNFLILERVLKKPLLRELRSEWQKQQAEEEAELQQQIAEQEKHLQASQTR